jgi:hypothetical protein
MTFACRFVCFSFSLKIYMIIYDDYIYMLQHI